LKEIDLSRKESEVDRISPDLIDVNPENPRFIFDEKQDLALLESIDEVGILVPLIVFPDEPGRFTLLDGERRLRCARRLNLKTVPVNKIAKPSKIENILRMFNIHNIREQWKLMPTALKLGVLLEDESFKEKSKREIGKLTGLSISTVGRCVELLKLDKKYQQMILEYYRQGEPKDFKFSEDFFLEMNRALNSIRKFQREIYDDYTRSGLIDRFVEKRKQNTITDVTDFRKIKDIIGATRKGASEELVRKTLRKLLDDTKFTIQQAYEVAAESVIKIRSIENLCRKLVQQLEINKEHLSDFSKREDFVKLLKEVQKMIQKILSEIKAKT
jgi:ParB family chromosome partitioning protein